MSYYIEIDGKPLCTASENPGYACAYVIHKQAMAQVSKLCRVDQFKEARIAVIPGPCPAGEYEQAMSQEHSDALEAVAGVIVMHGNISEGFEAFGPFDDFATAVDWIDREARLQFETRVMLLRQPRTMAEVLARTRDPEEQLMDAQDIAKEMREARGDDE